MFLLFNLFKMESFSNSNNDPAKQFSTPLLYIIKISCIISLFTNIFFLREYVKRIIEKKNSFIFKLFLTFGFIETIISILWILLYIFYINDKIMSFIFIFSIYYNTFFILCINHRLGLTVLNITNVNTKKIFLFIIPFIIGLFVSLISNIFDLFHNNESTIIIIYFRTISGNDKIYYKKIILYFFSILPIIALIIFFYQRTKIKGVILYQYDNENRIFYDSYSNKFLFYLLSHFLLSILYLIHPIVNYSNFSQYNIINFIILFILIINPLIELFIKIKHLKISCCVSKKKKLNHEISYYFDSSYKNENLDDSYFELSENEKIEKLENKNINHLTKDIFISICYCIEKVNKIKKNMSYENILEINKELSRENIVHTINRSKIISENSELSTDENILVGGIFSIECVEYAPEIFKYLRQLDNVKEEEIFNSMLPMNNESSFNKSEGKGGALFLNSYDKKFIIKTITYEELELMRNELLSKIVKYFNDNKDSLITRIYGLYKIAMFGSYSDQYFLLMKNNFGVFEKNVITKYDLKGSKYSREVHHTGKEEEEKNIVFKDINFNNKEGVLILNHENRNKLINIVSKDAEFLNQLYIMDYSLLVIKLKLNDDELINLFDSEFKKRNQLELNVIIAELKEGKQIIIPDENLREEYNPYAVKFNKKNTENLKKFIFPSLYDNEIYLISIIDYLQLYTLKKKIELQYKKIKADEKDISSNPPDEYKKRFIEYIHKITDENIIKNKIKEKFNI